MTHINDLINRIGKNLKHQLKWARRHNLEAWRIYDRDIPQYPFAIDVYRDHIHLQEYDTGWQQSPAERKAWLLEILAALEHITGFPQHHIHLKQRARQKGAAQYQKTGKTGEDFIIQENGRQFWVNLDKYLDTGLFLDHRNTRQKIGSIAEGKRFLNLFSYTGSFTVYAATGGAISSETVDVDTQRQRLYEPDCRYNLRYNTSGKGNGTNYIALLIRTPEHSVASLRAYPDFKARGRQAEIDRIIGQLLNKK